MSISLAPSRCLLPFCLLGLSAFGAALLRDGRILSSSIHHLVHSFHNRGDIRLDSLNLFSDTILWLSYTAIAATLGFFLWHNRKLFLFRGLLVVFSLFAAVCGLTHLMAVVLLWNPLAWLAGEIRLTAAALSVVTACMLPPLLPRLREFLLDTHRTRALEARFIAAVEGGSDAFYILEAVHDKNGEIVDFTYAFLNRNVEKMALLPGGNLLGRSLCELPLAGGALTFLELFGIFKTVMLTGNPQTREFQRISPGRPPAWITMQIVQLADGIAVTASDITAHKNTEAQALYMAHHDLLTGLPNRNLMDERLQRTLYRANRYRHKVAVFLIDLDSFKHINDTFGHAIGDEVLTVVANRLKQSVRVTDSVLRLGGDEFVVILPDVHATQDIERIATKILAEVAQPIPTATTILEIPCSLGICVYPDAATTSAQLLQNADEAMYIAKRGGGNRFSFCSTPPIDPFPQGHPPGESLPL